MQHPIFDPESWYQDRLKHLQCPSALAGSTSGPNSAVSIELARRKFRSVYAADLPAVPSHVFVWGIGEPQNRRLTKIGGLPFLSKQQVWPTDDLGSPVPFLAQISFVDSKNLFSFSLPGDVLLIFATDHAKPDHWRAVWQQSNVDDSELVTWMDVPCVRDQVPLFSHLWKSYCLPTWVETVRARREKANMENRNDELLHDPSHQYLFQHLATHISTSHYGIDRLRSSHKDAMPVASLASVSACTLVTEWPLLNSPHVLPSANYRGQPTRSPLPRFADLFKIGPLEYGSVIIAFSTATGKTTFTDGT